MVKIGFVGTGYIGGNLANYFEKRGRSIVRYSLEAEYIKNKKNIASCKIVFIAVPAGTTLEGFDSSILEEAIGLCAPDSTVVIKSTVPGKILKELDRKSTPCLLFSPEFLDEATAKADTEDPKKNIIGTNGTDDAITRAVEILDILPFAPYQKICSYDEASAIKYLHNASFVFKNVFWQMAYDLVRANGGNYEVVIKAILSDPRFTPVHTKPIDKNGRGAGGNCLIKDFAVFENMYRELFPGDILGNATIRNCRRKNNKMLADSGKDLNLLQTVYGTWWCE